MTKVDNTKNPWRQHPLCILLYKYPLLNHRNITISPMKRTTNYYLISQIPYCAFKLKSNKRRQAALQIYLEAVPVRNDVAITFKLPINWNYLLRIE